MVFLDACLFLRGRLAFSEPVGTNHTSHWTSHLLKCGSSGEIPSWIRTSHLAPA